MIPYTDELENQIAQVVAVSQELSINPQEFNTKGLLDQWAENKEFLYQRFGNQLIKSLGDYTLDLPAEEQFKLVEEFNANMYNIYGMFRGCGKLNSITCKQAFKDLCISKQNQINLPDAMREGGTGTWIIVD